eukprot:Hpha_TRINITY_DN15090_c5_g5::TRINITY_DN15090_c5_g5_i1::g.123397::m.123397/K14947/ESRP1_2; epithelial splicing regulatory protein 1/2
MGIHDNFVVVSVSATGCEEIPVQECEITEIAWAVFSTSTGTVKDRRSILVAPACHPTLPPRQGAVYLDQAIAVVDQYLDDHFVSQGESFVVVTDGPFALRRALKLECAAKQLRLAHHWSLYFDIRKEAMRIRPDCASTLTTLQAVMDAFALHLPPPSSAQETTSCVCAVLRKMYEQESLPSSRPQQIPYGDAAALERQWRASPVSRDQIQQQQHSAQLKAAQVCGFADEGGQMVCVRMRGLPFQATPTDVKRFFQGLTIAEDGIQFLYNLQGKSKGEAFVQFNSEEDATSGASRDKQFMGDRYIEVFTASLQDMRYCLAQSNPSTAGSTIVRCRGMPYNASPDEIQAFFEGCTVVHNGVALCSGNDGRPTGEAFVQFATEEDTSRALRRHRCHLGGRYVEIFRSSKQEMVNQCQQRLRAWGHKRGAARPSSPTEFSRFIVRLRGLPFSLNEVDVAALFAGLTIRTHGIHMVYSAEEKPTGEAFVEFETERDVEMAVSKHKSPMGHRYVEVFRSSPDEMMLAACGDWDLPDTIPTAEPQPTVLPTPTLVPVSVAQAPPPPTPVQTIRRVITVNQGMHPSSYQQQRVLVSAPAPQMQHYATQAGGRHVIATPQGFDMYGQPQHIEMFNGPQPVEFQGPLCQIEEFVPQYSAPQMGMLPQFAQMSHCDVPYVGPGMY